MKKTITEQQASFYTKNGYIEFEFENQLGTHSTGRDLWRQETDLQDLLLHKLGPIALALSGKKRLHLGCDQWFSSKDLPKKACALKEMFSIQGLYLGIILAKTPIAPKKRSPVGILPMPTQTGAVLFFRPDIILDWPHVSGTDLYIASFALPHAVYVQNPKDPATNNLKQFGYSFGDILQNEFHPVIATV